jgi:hypothetical protein
MVLQDWSVLYLHFLYEAGFTQIEDVATADISELTDADYIGTRRAKSLRSDARRVCNVSSSDGESTTDTATTGESSESDQVGQPSISSESTESDALTEGGPVTTDNHYPTEATAVDQWVLWERGDNGKKVPIAPWATNGQMSGVDPYDPNHWTSFESAKEWQQHLPGVGCGFVLTADDEFVLIDLDDVVRDGSPTQAAREILDTANSYTALSCSGTGIHVLGKGTLSEEVKTINGSIVDGTDQSVEVYEKKRFAALTGNHVSTTPTAVTDVQDLLTELEADYATVQSSSPDSAVKTPTLSREEITTLETTNDIQDIFDAISHTRPSDISLRSTQTNARADGTYSYDPSWTDSDSGTRLAVLDDGWIYRKGMIALDALQVVALEEGIITDERDYPDSSDFFKATAALRDRGAHIPRYEPETEFVPEVGDNDDDSSIDEGKVLVELNYGNDVRDYLAPSDRDYHEQMALKLAPVLTSAAEAVGASPAVTYRAAEIYAAAQAADIVVGASRAATLGAALRMASLEAGTPRPLDAIAAEFDTTRKAVQGKFGGITDETAIGRELDATDLIVEPAQYVSYLLSELEIDRNEELSTTVREVLNASDARSGTSPLSQAAAAVYAVVSQTEGLSCTQQEIAEAAGVTEVTIRNNYQKFRDQL